MKKIILAFVCMIGITTTNFAQNATQTEEQKAAMRAKNTEQIAVASKMAGLDEKEIGKVKVIIENLYKKQD